MKKVFITAAIGIVAFAVLVKSGVVDSLLIFLLAGQIPGTDYSVPSSFMLLAIISILWLVIFRFAGPETSRGIAKKRTKTRKAAGKKRMPKRRYAQILSAR